MEIFQEFFAEFVDGAMRFGFAIGIFLALQIAVMIVRGITRRIIRGIDSDDGRGVASISDAVESGVVAIVTGIAQLVALTTAFRVAGFDASEAIGLSGIIGLAFALASKDLILDAVGGLVALSAKHVQVGFWLEAADATGFVSEVGLFSTKLTDPTGIETYARNRMYVQDATIRTSGEEMNHAVNFDLNADLVSPVREIILGWAKGNPFLTNDPALVTVPNATLTGSGIPYRLVMPVAPTNYGKSIGWLSENPVSEAVYEAGLSLSVFDIGGSLILKNAD